MRRAAAAGGGVLASVAITSGAVAFGGGSTETPTVSSLDAAPDERAAAGPKLCTDGQVGHRTVEQALAGGWHASPATLDGCDDLSSFTQLD